VVVLVSPRYFKPKLFLIEFFRTKTFDSGRSNIPSIAWRFFQTKSQSFNAKGSLCRNSLRGVAVGTLRRFRVKTFDHLGLDDDVATHCYPPEGVVLELWYLSVLFRCPCSFGFPCTLLFIIGLICKRAFSSLAVCEFYKTGRKPILKRSSSSSRIVHLIYNICR
jgi:hypothetical protein